MANQNQIQRKLAHLRPYVWGLGTLSAGLLVVMAAVITFSVLA